MANMQKKTGFSIPYLVMTKYIIVQHKIVIIPLKRPLAPFKASAKSEDRSPEIIYTAHKLIIAQSGIEIFFKDGIVFFAQGEKI